MFLIQTLTTVVPLFLAVILNLEKGLCHPNKGFTWENLSLDGYVLS